MIGELHLVWDDRERCEKGDYEMRWWCRCGVGIGNWELRIGYFKLNL